MEQFLTTKEVAARLNLAEGTLRHWRHSKAGGPKFIKLGPKQVRYRAADVDAYVDACAQVPTAG